MDGGIIGGGRRPMGQGTGDAARVDFSCFGWGGKRRFEGKGVCFQPIKQSTVAEQAGIGELASVYMGI